MDVFSKAIGYMHDHLLKILKEQDDNEIAEEEIKWVLTVPAIWDDSAKQFIKDAAKQVHSLKQYELHFYVKFLFTKLFFFTK